MLRVRNDATNRGVLPFDPAGAPATWHASAQPSPSRKATTKSSVPCRPGLCSILPRSMESSVPFKSPEWQEWNLSVQQELNRTTVFIVNYVGNHGSRISYSKLVAECRDLERSYLWPRVIERLTTPAECYSAANNYATLTEYRQGAVSNYNGLTFSLRKQFNSWVSAHVNYTWSHNIDETSNGGLSTMASKEITPFWARSTRPVCGRITTETPTTMSATFSMRTSFSIRNSTPPVA